MSHAPASRGVHPRPDVAVVWAVAAGLVATAGVLGLLAGREPGLAIGLAVAMTFVGVVLADISTGFLLFAVVAFLEVLPGLGGGLSFARFAGLTLAISWLATTTTVSGRARRSFAADHPYATALAIVFLLWTAASTLWAESPAAVSLAFVRYAPNLLLLPIAYAALRTRRDMTRLAIVFVSTAIVSAAYGLLAPAAASAPTASDRLGGAGVDPNILAMALVGATAIAAGLAAMPRNSKGLRACAGIVAALCIFAILGTVSRGGIISLAVMLVLAAASAGRARRAGVIALVVVVALAGVTYVAAVAPTEVRQRITQSDGGAGRSDLWTIAWRMVQTSPVLGVGAGNFPVVSVHYLLRPGAITRSDFIVDNPKVAHNLYLEIPAELGLVGLALFLSIVGFAVRCGMQASRRFGEAGDPDMEILSRAFALGASGMLVANIFVSQQFNKPMWILLATGPALLALAQRETTRAAERA